MNLESIVLIYSMINNIILAIIKVIGGFTFGLGSLFADGLHTFSDFVTDVICMIGATISKKKPTKYHPFGFGRIEYVTNIFVGYLLLALSIFIIYHGIVSKTVVPPLSILWLVTISFVLKHIAIIIMNRVGKKINSNVLLTSVQESKADLYSSFGVGVITVALQFVDKYPILIWIDLIGSVLIGVIVLKTAVEIIYSNTLSVIGEAEYNEEVYKEVKKYLKQYKEIEHSKIHLLKCGPYYNLQLSLDIIPTLTLKKAETLINKIKSDLMKNKELKINYVIIYICDSL